MGIYFGSEYIGERFTLFSSQHFLMLSILVIAIILMVILKKIAIKSNKQNIIRYMLIIGLILSETSFYLWHLYNATWEMKDSLPLQLCSISLYLCIYMLITKKKFIFEITFFFALGGAMQALLTPNLVFNFPHFRFIQFFILHILVVLAPIYMVIYEGYKPTLKSLWKAMASLNIIALFVFIINKLIGANYMFLARKPGTASLMDVLGDYPWYILSLEVVAFILFFIILLPFIISEKLNKRKNI